MRNQRGQMGQEKLASHVPKGELGERPADVGSSPRKRFAWKQTETLLALVIPARYHPLRVP